jgi:glycosyltransferase involved in cell wall biosynthesis
MRADVARFANATANHSLRRRRFFTPIPASAPVPRLLLVDHHAREFLQHRLSVARALLDAGFDVHVAVPRERGLDDVSRQGIPVYGFYLRRKSVRPWDEVRCLFSLLRLYLRLRPALVHHCGLKPTLYGGIAARFVGVPAAASTLTGLGYLFATRNARTRVLRSIVEAGLRFAFRHRNHRVIFQNPDDRNRLVASGTALGDCSVLIRGSGVDLSQFTRLPEPGGTPVILMASRLLWEKGVGEFVRAAQAIRARRIHARFVLVGEPDRGHPSAVPLSTLERWHEAGDIEWLGWRDDISALIAQSHIVCLPSCYGEGLPRILIEAAASGRPIVCFDSVGCREVVRHGQNGLLVSLGDCEALVDAIVRLIQDAPLRAAMGARGREIAAMEFPLGKTIDAYFAVHGSLLASTKRSGAAP